MRIFQKGFNFGQDGPGNRLVYHLQGCNMHCIWCSNPEGMKSEGGKEYTPSQILDECMRSRMMFFSGGGVTFTGGECTLQMNDLLETCRLLKENGIHTCIETNGTSPRLPELSPYIDYLIMDFKHHDSGVLKEFTRVGNEKIKNNYEWLCTHREQYHVRIPLINHFNADSPEAFAEYFSSVPHDNVVFEFLSYHEYGKDKWTEEYLVKDGFISKDTVPEYVRIFREHGLKVIST